MILAAALALLAASQEKESLVPLGLRYLARHQAADGSWGQRGTSCDCPSESPRPDPPVDAASRARIEALIRELDDDDFRRREEALKGVIAVGEPAVPLLRECASKGPPEAQWRSKTALRRIAAGGTSADVEITAMALVAFLGAGFSHLSKDVYDDLHFGTAVKEGLQWLLARQGADGSFEGATLAGQAWAALALAEAYGMTASNPLKEPAQRAIDYIVSHPARDARGVFYQGMAIKSAELAELTYPREVHPRSAVAIAACRADEPASIFARAATQILQIFAYRNKRFLDLTGLPGIDPSRMEIETVYVAGLALFQADGPRGPAWTAFLERQKEFLVPGQNHVHGMCDRGAWEAVGIRERLRTCALATLSCEVYYR
jgi:hypothetical protein